MEQIKRVYETVNNSISKFGVKVDAPKFDFSKELNEKISSEELSDSSNEKKNLDQIINEASQKYNLPENLIKSVIQTESSFNADAVSPKGAQGLMQLMPNTAKGLGVENPFDEEENVMGGSKYLSGLIDKYGDIKLALAAYNAGPGNVDRFGGIPPFPETQNYVSKIMDLLGSDSI